MKTIRWYDLNLGRIPKSSKPLHVGIRDGTPVVWCEVDPDDQELQEVTTICTGGDLPNKPLKYIGTIQGVAGFLVLHYYIDA